jgi:hypothetical protein
MLQHSKRMAGPQKVGEKHHRTFKDMVVYRLIRIQAQKYQKIQQCVYLDPCDSAFAVCAAQRRLLGQGHETKSKSSDTTQIQTS